MMMLLGYFWFGFLVILHAWMKRYLLLPPCQMVSAVNIVAQPAFICDCKIRCPVLKPHSSASDVCCCETHECSMTYCRSMCWQECCWMDSPLSTSSVFLSFAHEKYRILEISVWMIPHPCSSSHGHTCHGSTRAENRTFKIILREWCWCPVPS